MPIRKDRTAEYGILKSDIDLLADMRLAILDLTRTAELSRVQMLDAEAAMARADVAVNKSVPGLVGWPRY